MESADERTATHAVWSALTAVWREAFALAATAYLQFDSLPVGAVITDANGSVLARGRNSVSTHRLGHAEMDAFAQLPLNVDRRHATLHVTVEPCPMCTGAIRMMQIGCVHFASVDPAAGATAWLGQGQFMREVPCVVAGPDDPALEQVIVALVVEHRLRTGHLRWRQQWLNHHPKAVAAANRMVENRAFHHWREQALSAAELYEAVLDTCRAA